MNRVKAKKPELNIINPDTIANQVQECIEQYCNIYGIDLYNYSVRVNIKHMEVNNILRYCYNSLFKPDKGLMNNQKSLIDYDNIDQLQAVTDIFLNVCSMFNKSLGLFSFSLFTGIDDNTLIRWSDENGKQLNYKRWELLKSIKEYNKGSLVSILKDTPVGALAVANNDVETGLEWSKNQVNQITNNTVYLLPSERSEHLRLDKLPE